jgi:hypothetical protein
MIPPSPLSGSAKPRGSVSTLEPEARALDDVPVVHETQRVERVPHELGRLHEGGLLVRTGSHSAGRIEPGRVLDVEREERIVFYDEIGFVVLRRRGVAER